LSIALQAKTRKRLRRIDIRQTEGGEVSSEVVREIMMELDRNVFLNKLPIKPQGLFKKLVMFF
jgi:hypothetical protein